MELTIDTQKTISRATPIFSSYCRFKKASIKDRRSMKNAMDLMDELRGDITIRAVLEYYDEISLEGKVLKVAGRKLSCMYFEKTGEEKLPKAVFAYALTTGTWPVRESITEEFFIDTWGSAMTEASSAILRDQIRSMTPAGCSISPELGPGYYGMPSEESSVILSITGAFLIGVDSLESGMLLPQKSCCGIYAVYEGDPPAAPAACAYCKGSRQGCSFCNHKDDVR